MTDKPIFEEEFNTEHFPLSDVMDREILMQRDVHFGGKFDIMIEYYQNEGKGRHPEIEIGRIKQLQKFEEESGENIAPLLLSGADAEKVGRAKDAYKKLRSLYENEQQQDIIPLLIADLIFSEDEEAEEEVASLIQQKNKCIPFLLDLLRSQDFHDSLFPGYGQAPFLAAKCLGKLGKPEAIFPLFEEIGEGDFFNEKTVLYALREMGEPAKTFLLKVLKSEPRGEDNERAALALISFQQDPDVGEACLSLLENPNIFSQPSLAVYVILICEGLKDEGKRKRFKQIASEAPKEFQQDMNAVISSWLV